MTARQLIEAMNRRSFLGRLTALFGGAAAGPGVLASLGKAAKTSAAAAPQGWTVWTYRMNDAFKQIKQRFIDERVRGYVTKNGLRVPGVAPEQAAQAWDAVAPKLRHAILNSLDLDKKLSLRGSEAYRPDMEKLTPAEREKWEAHDKNLHDTANRQFEQSKREYDKREAAERAKRAKERAQRPRQTTAKPVQPVKAAKQVYTSRQPTARRDDDDWEHGPEQPRYGESAQMIARRLLEDDEDQAALNLVLQSDETRCTVDQSNR